MTKPIDESQVEIRSTPHQWCLGCGANRDVTLHQYGRGFPPDKAKNYLKKQCPRKGERACKFTYRAGVVIGPRPCGQ